MTAIVLRGDARTLPLPDASVDLIVTSPPYWGLRSYTDGGKHYDGQIGSEDTPAEWLQAMVECTREWARVLKSSGSIFVNLGDRYSARANAGASRARSGRADHAEILPPGRSTTGVAPAKSLLLLPERYRIACLDELGLTVRAVVVWHKVNGLPESVVDRVRRSHEDWVHLTKGPRYFAAVDEIRETHRGEGRSATARGLGYVRTTTGDGTGGDRATGSRGYTRTAHELGRLPGSVWDVPSERLTIPAELGVDHFAAFPMAWPQRLIAGWSPAGICTDCGEGRRPVHVTDWSRVPHRVEQQRHHTPAQVRDWTERFLVWATFAGVTRQALDEACGTNGMGRHWTNPGRKGSQIPTPEQWALISARFNPPTALADMVHATVPVRVSLVDIGAVEGAGRHRNTGPKVSDVHTSTGYACACAEPTAATRPAVVLDPFGGTGTTALVASALGRVGITVDLSADYCRIAEWRTTDPGQIAKAKGGKQPAVEILGQADILADLGVTV